MPLAAGHKGRKLTLTEPARSCHPIQHFTQPCKSLALRVVDKGIIAVVHRGAIGVHNLSEPALAAPRGTASHAKGRPLLRAQ